MRTRSILGFSSQGIPQALTAVVALLAFISSTLVEPVWAADSASATAPSSASSAATAPARAHEASMPVPRTDLPDVPRPRQSGRATPAPNLSAANQLLQRESPVFIENRGQFDARVKFLVRGNGANLWLTNEGIVFDFQRPAQKQSSDVTGAKRQTFDPRVKSQQPPMERLVFKQKLVSGNANPTIDARDPQPGIYNYFLGSDPNKWRSHVLAYKEVVYRDVWAGVDLKLYANGPNLEEEFIVHPGADASAVRLAYDGIEGLTTQDDGSLRVATAFGDMLETSPRIYQESSGKTIPVAGNFKVNGNAYTFEISKRDEHSDLTIDPTVLYSTYLGGSAGNDPYRANYEVATGVAVDAGGNAYVTGYTRSEDFPVTPGAFQTTYYCCPVKLQGAGCK